MVQSVFKVSSSSFPKMRTHPGSARPGLPPPPPPHPPTHPCLPKSATLSACIWTMSCVLTESGTPILWRTRTSWPGRQCATTGALSTSRKTLIGLSLRPRLGRESQSQPSSCSPSPTHAITVMSESPKYMDAHWHTHTYMHINTHNYSMNIPPYECMHRNMKRYTVSQSGRTHIDME